MPPTCSQSSGSMPSDDLRGSIQSLEPAVSKNNAFHKALDNYFDRIKEQGAVWSPTLSAYVAKYTNKTESLSSGKRKADEAFSSERFHLNESDGNSAEEKKK